LDFSQIEEIIVKLLSAEDFFVIAINCMSNMGLTKLKKDSRRLKVFIGSF